MSFVGQRRSILRPLVPYFVWEGVLLVVLLLLLVLARGAEPQFFSGGAFLAQWALVGLTTSAVALSLRMGTPNLAIPALAAVSSAWFVDRVNDGSSMAVAAIVVVLLCLLHGLMLGAFVGATGVPAWAASLGTFALLQAYLFNHQEGRVTPLGAGSGPDSYIVWFLVFVFGSVLAAVALATYAVRAPLAWAGPAGMRSRLVSALIGLGGSSAAAGLVGVLLALRFRSSSPSTQFDLLLLALGAALLAGISVYGGQGPIFGVVLASGIAVTIFQWSIFGGLSSAAQMVLAGLLILVGLLVGWGLGHATRRLARR